MLHNTTPTPRLPRSHTLIAGLLAIGLSAPALAATDSTTNPWTAGGGFIAGGLLAGPVGAVIGAWAGDRLGSTRSDSEAQQQAAITAINTAEDTRTSSALALQTIASPIEIDFATNASAPDSPLDALLPLIVTQLNQHPEWRLVVETHADRRGRAGYNQRLSERRAEALKEQLIASGLAAERIELRAFGELKAEAGIDDPAGLLRDRRARLYLRSAAEDSLAYRF